MELKGKDLQVLSQLIIILLMQITFNLWIHCLSIFPAKKTMLEKYNADNLYISKDSIRSGDRKVTFVDSVQEN